MDKVFACHGPQFAGGEEAGQRDVAQGFADCRRVVMRLRKHPGAASVAGEQQGAAGLSAGLLPRRREQLPQIRIGRLGIADVELDGLPDAHVVADHDRAGVRVDPQDVADQEIALLEAVLVLADDAAHVQPAADHLLFACGQRDQHLVQLDHGRLAAQFVDHVLFGARDHEVLADRPATLRDDGLHAHRTGQQHGDGARRPRLAVPGSGGFHPASTRRWPFRRSRADRGDLRSSAPADSRPER